MVIRTGQTLGEGLFINTVRFAKIIKRARVIAQLGVDEAYEKVGVHRFEGFEIHAGTVNKAESG